MTARPGGDIRSSDAITTARWRAVVTAGVRVDTVAVVAILFVRVHLTITAIRCFAGVAAGVVIKAIAIIALLALFDGAVAAD
jgi:hypothetical protein